MKYSIIRQEWIQRFVAWAKAREDIRAVILVGSMSSQDHDPADEWSDVDLLFITTKPDTYTKNNAWMSEVSPFWAGVIPPDEIFGGLLPIHCGFSVFEAGVAADFLILSKIQVQKAIPAILLLNRFPLLRRWLPENVATLGADAGDFLRNGAQILFDKDGLAKRLRETTLAIAVIPSAPPSQEKFQNNVDDFWIGPPRIAVHLLRGRLMAAMKTLDLSRRDLLKMVEWHARSKNGWDSDDMTYRPKQIEAWADSRAIEALPHIYANYNPDELWQALIGLMHLYPVLAMETAEALGYPCLSKSEQIIDWVKERFSEYSKAM